MAEKKKNDILLETGTNELQILEFTISDRHFGINVSKVLELMPRSDGTPMPNSNPFVEGVFKPRNDIITIINLPAYLGLGDSVEPEKDIFIITNFNKNCSAFHVHTVETMHRISWESVEKPDPAIYGGHDGLATGIARIDGRLVTIVDFEKILADISPSTSIQISDIDQLGVRETSVKPILVAEDSPMLEKMIMDSLEKSGYTNLLLCTNGKEAWDTLNAFKATGRPIEEFVKIVITDIEMPQMDGHRLTKLIREDDYLKNLPVIIFSSLINEEMRSKGLSVGATAQLSKPEIVNLVKMVDANILP